MLGERKEIVGKAAVVSWFIWKARNEWVFTNSQVELYVVVGKASSFWREIFQTPLPAGGPIPAVLSLSQSRPVWQRPGRGCLKINCDASVAAASGRTSIAAVLRDWQGRLVDGVVVSVQSSSVLQGEARAVRLACRLLQALGLSNVQVESDCQVAIDLSVSELDPPWDCLALLHDIQSLKPSLRCSFAWIPRAANRVTHWVASSHLKGGVACGMGEDYSPSFERFIMF